MPRKIEEEAIEEVKTTTSDDSEELFDYYAPKTRELQDDIFVGLNGKNWLIQRGKHVKVPKACYEILMNKERMENIALERQEEAQGMTKYN